MPKDWFDWKGVRCTTKGIHVTRQPDVFRASERLQHTAVPGRSGTLTVREGEDVYDDFILPVECAVNSLESLDVLTAYLRGTGSLVLAALDGYHYVASVVNQIEFAQVMRGRDDRTFTVTFRCAPYRYKDNVTDIAITQSGSFVENPGNIASEPIIKVTGSGDITLLIGTQAVTLTGLDGSVTIDTPLKEAYDGDESMNGIMDGDFPTLAPGRSAISWTGSVTGVTITPNWRYV